MIAIANSKQTLNPGRCSMSRGILIAFGDGDHETATKRIVPAMDRFVQRDWGDLSPDDWNANDDDLHAGGPARLLAVYHLPNSAGMKTKIYVAHHLADGENEPATVVMLPEEY
jgi:hypothetical protein